MGKFDGHGPYSIVREVQELKKKVQRASSAAQNAAALARRAIPTMQTVNVAKSDQTFLTSTFTDVMSTSIDIPDGVQTAYITTGYCSTGSTLIATGGGVVGTYLDVIMHGDQDWRFTVAPAISTGTPGPSAIVAVSNGGGTFQGWLQDYGITSIELVAGGYRSGDAQANTDNVHLTAAVMFYR